MIADPKDPAQDQEIPDVEPAPAPDIAPGDPGGLKPVKEPFPNRPKRAV